MSCNNNLLIQNAVSESLYKVMSDLEVYYRGKGKVGPVFNYALRHEGVWGSGCVDPHFLGLGTSWR
jgi:hypothetical protein